MLRLPIFKYHRPNSLAEALTMLRELQPDAMLLAGGTDLLPNMKRKLFTPKHVIGIGHLTELSYVKSNSGGFHLGAATPLDVVETAPELAQAYPALVKAVSSISTPQLRNSGTIGGNLCLDTRCNYYNQSYFWRQALGFCMKKDASVCRVALSSAVCLAAHSADTAPVLTVLDATVTIRNASGERMVKLADLYRNDGMTFLKLERDEILTDVYVPAPDGWRAAYHKLRDRESFDFPIAGVAVGLKLDGDMVEDVRVATTGMFSAPLPLRSVEDTLRGQRLTAESIDAAAEAGYKEAHPVDNTSGTIVQRKNTVRVFIRRALKELSSPA
ncbi:MAG TPA: FAD binding domain-containing protein [Chloroflexota bacterium]|nr:FAD binding domain-containing protein [Chloroflexota bacterium]